MNFIRVGVLSIALMFAALPSGTPKENQGGYDIGACFPEPSFVALHIEVSENDLKVSFINPSPGEIVQVPDPQVFKYVSESGGVYHYEFKGGKDTYQLVLKYDGNDVDGVLLDNGVKAAKVYGSKQPDEKNLAANGYDLFQQCNKLLGGSIEDQVQQH